MAKKLKVDLAIQADGAYSCSSIKDYTDQFVVEQEVEYSAASNFQTISEFSKNKGALTVQNAKAIVIKNISNITAELLIKVQAYKNTSSVDVMNSDALGLTGVRHYRYWSALLPAGDFIYLPNARIVAYEETTAGTIESATSAPVGTIAIEPKDIYNGNEYRGVQEIDGTTYGAGTEILNNGAIASVTATSLTVDDGSWFKVDDTIFFGTEVARVTNISTNTLTIERALFGSTAIALSNDEPINYFFGNHYLPFDNGKCMTSQTGQFKQTGAFFGYARTTDKLVDGLVAGSVAIGSFYTEGGYLDWGLQNIKPSDNTGLAASTAYAITFVIDEFNAGGIDSTSTEQIVSFTTDSSDVTFASSSNAVLPKIQAQLDAYFYDEASGLKNKKVTIGIHKGDVRVTSVSNHSETRVGISKSTSGTTPFDVGRFPTMSSNVPDLQGSAFGGGTTDTIVYGVASSLAPETIDDKTTGKTITNTDAFIFDDGNGNLLYNGNTVGWIDYEKGHCEFQHLPNAEFKIYGQSHSAHSGGVSFVADGFNSIQSIQAKSVNIKESAKLKTILIG